MFRVLKWICWHLACFSLLSWILSIMEIGWFMALMEMRVADPDALRLSLNFFYLAFACRLMETLRKKKNNHDSSIRSGQ